METFESEQTCDIRDIGAFGTFGKVLRCHEHTRTSEAPTIGTAEAEGRAL